MESARSNAIVLTGAGGATGAWRLAVFRQSAKIGIKNSATACPLSLFYTFMLEGWDSIVETSTIWGFLPGMFSNVSSLVVRF